MNSSYSGRSESFSPFPRSSSKSCVNDPVKEQKHTLFIETRWIPPRTYPLPLVPENPVPPVKSPRSPRSLPRSPRVPKLNEPETETG
jgi:hypothetical protein